MKVDAEVIIANISAVLSFICISVGISAKGKVKMMAFMTANCGINVITNLLLRGWSGAVIQTVNMIRNMITAAGKMTKALSWIIMIVMALLGIAVNNQGIYGLLPLIASAEYTLSLSSENMLLLKTTLMINMLLWSIYNFVIRNYVGGITSGFLAVQALVEMGKLIYTDKKGRV